MCWIQGIFGGEDRRLGNFPFKLSLTFSAKWKIGPSVRRKDLEKKKKEKKKEWGKFRT